MPPTTVAFGLRNRKYEATCTNVQQQLIQPSEDEPMERTNLSFTLKDIKPYDLKDSNLLEACFRRKTGGKQQTLETALKGQAKIEADYNCLFEVLDLDKGTRHDEDVDHRLTFAVHDGPLADGDSPFDGGYLRPRSGIKIKSIEPSDNSYEGSPMVNIALIAKGFDYWIGGYGWLTSDFQMGFEAKSKAELEEEGAESEKKRKEKGDARQGELKVEVL